jgi:peptidoglycan/LPS O-acetylase OafA/YrhL
MALSQGENLRQLSFLARLRRGMRRNSAKPPASSSASLATISDDLEKVLKTKVISGLDALRTIAVSLVLVEHFGVVKGQTGSLGVMIFFVLSGFLITSMLLKEYRKSGSISLRNFYRRRAFRIFPTFYVCWILTTIVQYLSHRLYWKTAIISFFYMMDYGRGLAPARMVDLLHLWISWSLAIEEKFYLLWPLLLLWLLKKRSTLIRTMCFIIVGQWTYRAILYLGFHVHWTYVYSTFDMRVDALLVGCLLAVLAEGDRTRLLACQVLRWQWLSAIPAVILALIAMDPPSRPSLYLLSFTLQPILIAAWLLQFVYWGSRSWTICSSFIVRFTARISYSLYLYHPLAGQIIYELHARHPKYSSFLHLGYSAVVLTLVMSIASYYCVERPFIRMRDKGDRSQKKASPPAIFRREGALNLP